MPPVDAFKARDLARVRKELGQEWADAIYGGDTAEQPPPEGREFALGRDFEASRNPAEYLLGPIDSPAEQAPIADSAEALLAPPETNPEALLDPDPESLLEPPDTAADDFRGLMATARQAWHGLAQTGAFLSLEQANELRRRRAASIAELETVRARLPEDQRVGAALGNQRRQSELQREILQINRELPIADANVPEAVRVMAERVGKASAAAADRSPEMRAYDAAKGREAAGIAARNPFEWLANVALSGAISSIPAAAYGAAGGLAAGPPGMAAGLGVGSYAVEYANHLLQSLDERGVNIEDPETLALALQDPVIADELRTAAVRRGLGVGAFDAISGALAGRFLGPALGRGAGSVARAGVKEVATQGALGGAGEVAGSVAAGDPVRPGDVAAEIGGEILPGLGEAAQNAMQSRARAAREAQLSRPRDIEARPADAAPLADIPANRPPPPADPSAPATAGDVANLADSIRELQEELRRGQIVRPAEPAAPARPPEPPTPEPAPAPTPIAPVEVAPAPAPDPQAERLLAPVEPLPPKEPTPAAQITPAPGAPEGSEPPEPPIQRTAIPRPQERPFDLLEWLQSFGQIRPKKYTADNSKSLFDSDDYKQLISGTGRQYFGATGVAADVVADQAYQQGLIAEPTSDALFAAMLETIQGRRAQRRRGKSEKNILRTEERQRNAFEREAFNAKPGRQKIDVGELVAGDTVQIGNETLVVERLEFDPESDNLDAVVFRDGPRFGVQAVDADQFIFADDVVRPERTAQVEFLPVDEAPAAVEQRNLTPSEVAELRRLQESQERTVREEQKLRELETAAGQGTLLDVAARPVEDIEEEKRRAEQRAEILRRQSKPMRSGALEAQGALFGAEAQRDAFELTLDRLKADIRPGDLQAFGVLPHLWNGLIETVRAAYRGGKALAQAVEEGLAWLRKQQKEPFEEDALRRRLAAELSAQHTEKFARRDAILGRIDEIDTELVRGQFKLTREQARALREERASLWAEFSAMQYPGKPVGAKVKDATDPDYQAEGERLAEKAAEARRKVQEAQATGQPVPPELVREAQAASDDLMTHVQAAPRRPARVDSNIELDPAGAASTPRRPVPQFKGEAKLPGGTIRDAFSALRRWRQRAGEWWRRGPLRQLISAEKDAAENRSGRAANQVANRVRLVLNRAFGDPPGKVTKSNELREYALTFAVEADGDRAKLADFHATISESAAAATTLGKRALRAIEFAEANWDKLAPAAAEYKTLSAAEREIELNEGVDSNEWQGGYVYHRWKKDPEGSADPTQPRGVGTPFRRRRTVETYADGIAEGLEPQNLSAIKLLAARVASGQNKLNELRWVWGLRSVVDTETGDPVVTDLQRFPRRPRYAAAEENESAFETAEAAQWETRAPKGYVKQRFGDLEVAVHRSFSGLLTDLTAGSVFSSGPKRVIRNLFGFSKSVLLMFDTFHLGRMAAWFATMLSNPLSMRRRFKHGLSLLDYSTSDLREMAQRGEIPQEILADLEENKRLLNLAVDNGYNVGQVVDNLASDWVHALPGIGAFNEWLFQQFQRGAMAEAWLIEFKRLSKAMPRASEEAVARQVTRDLNTRFGNLGRQGLFKSRTAQDIARMVFLAPQWNESLIRAEVGAIGQVLASPITSFRQRRLVLGTLGRSAGVMLLGTFLANQVLSYIFRGKPTWENDEEGWERKISAWIPDAIGNGPGFFLNPLALPMEYTHLIAGNLHRSRDSADAAWRIVNSRLSSPSRALFMLATRKDALGRAVRPGEVWSTVGGALVPAPIAGGTVAAAVKQVATGQPSETYPGQFQKQVLASFGMKTDQAPNPEQRMRALATEFNRAKGVVPAAEYFAGDYEDLTKALRIGNQRDAAQALEDLKKKKTGAQILEHYARWSRAPFTGRPLHERQFLKTLSEEQRATYNRARAERIELAKTARRMVRGSAPVQ